MTAERDRLRAVVDAVRAMWDDLTAVDEDGTQYQFPAAHYAPIDDGLDALGATVEWMPVSAYDEVVAERDRLRAVVDRRVDDHNSAIEALVDIAGITELLDGPHEDADIVAGVRALRAERDRLRAVVDALRRHRDADARWTALSEGGDEDEVSVADTATVIAWNRVVEALAALDVSPDMGGEP